MTILLNGQERPLAAGATIADLLTDLGLAEARVAVERNRSIVARADWPSTELAEDDAIEVVQFVGGG